MSFHEFWGNVRSHIKVTDGPRFIADVPRLEGSAIERKLREERSWLSPQAVAGFEKSDLDFLDEAERTRLDDLVRGFSEIVKRVKPRTAAPAEAVEEALPFFKGIIQLLEFVRFADSEAFRLGKPIEREIREENPDALEELRFNTGFDHSDDPAIWIWVYLTAEASEFDETFLNCAQALRELIDPVARRNAPGRWPYISFRSIQDLSVPVEAA